jgi:hypothetical protein
MAKKNKGLMGRSDIPLAQRLQIQRQAEIVSIRNQAAKVAMYCRAVALHDVEGIGYKRLVRFTLRFKENIDYFYEDVEVCMAHATQRLAQMGRPISGALFTVDPDGRSKRRVEMENHALQAAQIALICSDIATNDEFGFGQVRQDRVAVYSEQLAARYNKEGEGFLLAELKKIGFLVVDGEVRAFLNDDDQPITPKQAKREGIAWDL